MLNAQSIHTSSTCHAERSEASMSGFLAGARNDTFGSVMLNGAQRSEASTLD